MKKSLIMALVIMTTALSGCKADITVKPADDDVEEMKSFDTIEFARYEQQAKKAEQDYNIDLTQYEDLVQLIIIDDIIWHPEDFNSKNIRIQGQARTFTDDGTGRPFHMCLVSYADDVEPAGLEFVLADGNYPKDGEIITVEGMFMYYEKEKDGQTYVMEQIREAKIVDPKSLPFSDK